MPCSHPEREARPNKVVQVMGKNGENKGMIFLARLPCKGKLWYFPYINPQKYLVGSPTEVAKLQSYGSRSWYKYAITSTDGGFPYHLAPASLDT